MTVKHNSKDKKLTAFAAWGTDGFGPSAELVIERGDGVWRLTKTYLFEAICTLKRDTAARLEIQKNQQAEQTLDGWREGDGAAGRLMLALWSAQNDPLQDFDDALSPGARAALLEPIVARAGRGDASSPFTQVKRSVSNQYEGTFTEKRKEIRAGSELDRAVKSLVDARAHLDRLQERSRELEEMIADHAARSARHEQDCRARDALRQERAERARRAVTYREQAGALDRARQRADQLRQRLQQQESEQRCLARADEERERAEATLRDLEPRLEAGGRAGAEAAEHAQKLDDRIGPALEQLEGLANLFERRDRRPSDRDRPLSRPGPLAPRRHLTGPRGCSPFQIGEDG